MNSPRFFAASAALRPLFLILAFFFTHAGSARAALDVNNDGVPDVWAMLYSAEALAVDADPDGDGLSTAQEALAGTDPRSPGSVVKVSAMSLDAAGLHLTFPTLPGKQYQVQTSAGLAAPNWQSAGSPFAGTGADVSAVLSAAGATEKFYRVLVLDTDSDGDGVTDWEELTLGFDPTSSHSGGLSGGDDRTAITQALQSPNTLSIAASDPAASEVGTDTGTFVITRTGNFTPLTVRYAVSGTATAGSDYTPLSGTVTLPIGVRTASFTVTPLADATTESNEAVVVSLTADPAYTIGSPSVATVLISDAVQANGTGLTAEFFNEATTGTTAPSTTNAPLMTNRVLLRDGLGGRPAPDAQVSNDYALAPWPGAPVNATFFASRWTGEVLPEFSQIYTFYTNVNLGGRLWVNGKLLTNNWPRTGYTVASAEASSTIELQAGVRYPIVFEHYETTGNNSKAILSWQSANTNGGVRQVIPQARLFANARPQITSETDVLLLKNSGPYTYQIAASGSPTGYGAANLPTGWSFNVSTGAISGSPTQAGEWEIPISATNAFGSGSAVLRLRVIATGGGISRDLWTNVAGDTVAQIPLATAPTSTSTLLTLEGPQNEGDNYGARIRGYLTAPVTGIYKFWITADQAAELWISNDSDAINVFKRAEVLAPTAFRGWAEAGAGKSPLLFLEAGQRYFVEVRHKESVGADHVSVGWLKPGQGGNDPASVAAPSEVVPAYALSQYAAPAPVGGESTLYTANLTTQGAAMTSGYGSASLQVSADETQAVLRYSYANLSTPVSNQHIHMDAWNGHPQGEIVFDIDDATPLADGSYVWDIVPSGTFTSAAEVRSAIRAGVAYINIHTVNYPNGEIRGNFRLQSGSTTFTAPPAAQAWTDDHADANAAARFLVQTTFGVSGADANADGAPDAISEVQSLGYAGWIDAQMALPPTLAYPYVFTNRNLTSPNSPTYSGTLMFNSWWKNAVTAPDQLRQRVAFALSEILVISESGPLDDRADAISDFYDLLLNYGLGNPALTPEAGAPPADGNFLNLLKAATLHPAMGRYLDMLNNDKPVLATGRIPNENYAREILQLFSVGLNRMWPDGSLMLNSKGEPIPIYDQNAIIGFAHAFTGWGYNYTGAPRTSFPGAANWLDPMREVPVRHFTGQKRLLNNVVLPGLPAVLGQPLDPYATHTAAQYGDAAYVALAAQELDATHQLIFNHPNTAPFVCRQLIQRLVTSTPSRGYIYRVVQKFNDNGAGVRGDLKAVVKAILLDYEARGQALLAQQGYGKQREPVSRVAAVARAFPAPAPISGTYSQTGNLISVSVSPAQTFANGSNLYLDFSGGTPSDPDDAPYSISGVTTTGSTTTFTVRPLSSETAATYTQSGAILTVNVPGEHSFNTAGNNNAYLDFTSVAPAGAVQPADGNFTVTSVTSDELNFTVGAPGSKQATYSQTANTTTLTFPAAHGFLAGSTVRIDFVSASAGTAASGDYTVATVSSDGLQFTIAYPADATTRTGTAHAILSTDVLIRNGALVATRAAYVVDRSGAVSASFSDWNMDTTDTDLNQTPMRSPTVFNFFEPDYSHPGLLAQAGLITPEFQLTSDTSVMRQANFLYNGLFSELHSTPGLSSFKSGARDVALDFRTWMGNGPGGVPWTNDVNLNALIDKLNTLLLAGQLPSSGANTVSGNTRTIVNAKQVIYDYVRSQSNLTYSATAPTAAQKRDRIRAVIHLLISSSDFAIQK